MPDPAGTCRERGAGHAFGDQSGGVFLFPHTDDFHRDHTHMRTQGVEFVRERGRNGGKPWPDSRNLYGNLWDLIGPQANAH